jgi:hypothetical protein
MGSQYDCAFLGKCAYEKLGDQSSGTQNETAEVAWASGLVQASVDVINQQTLRGWSIPVCWEISGQLVVPWIRVGNSCIIKVGILDVGQNLCDGSWTCVEMILEPLMVGTITSTPNGINAEASQLQSQENLLRVKRRSTIVIDFLFSFFSSEISLGVVVGARSLIDSGNSAWTTTWIEVSSVTA